MSRPMRHALSEPARIGICNTEPGTLWTLFPGCRGEVVLVDAPEELMIGLKVLRS